MVDGICTLANDRVYDQLIALLNSIESVLGKDFPVCICPYDEQLEKLTSITKERPQVEIYSDYDSMAMWDNFAKAAWDTHPSAFQRWKQVGSEGYHRFGTHRRYCAFSGPFDRFLYMDADTLLLSDPRSVFDHLKDHSCIVYDFQFKDLTHVYESQSPKLPQIFSSQRLEKEIFCSGFYASHQGEFSEEQRNWLLSQLREGDAEILYPMAPDQTLINYMMMRLDKSIYNLSLHLSSDQRTGNSVTSLHFENQNNLLYDKGNPLTYLHYIGISSKFFAQVCEGKNIDFPYRDIFLHYRYLHDSDQRPKFKGKPKLYNQPPSLGSRILKKLNLSH